MIVNALGWLDGDRTLAEFDGPELVKSLLGLGVANVVVDVEKGDTETDALAIDLPETMSGENVAKLLEETCGAIEVLEDEDDTPRRVWLRYVT